MEPEHLSSMDPHRLSSVDWTTTASILHNLWLVLIFVIPLAFLMLLAHAVIPSVLASGHAPEGLRNLLRKQRLPMYLTALALLGGVAFWLARATHAGYQIAHFWSRFWI